jgi:hypothetical protein
MLTIQQIVQGDVDRSVETPYGRPEERWPHLVFHHQIPCKIYKAIPKQLIRFTSMCLCTIYIYSQDRSTYFPAAE